MPNQKTATVWGTLPGATDETIYVMAHRDGWFDAATDNASGVATMVGLAEHFAKVPRPATAAHDRVRRSRRPSQRAGGIGRMWMVDHRDELFAKTALAINAEHTSTIQTYLYGERIRRANTYTAQLWYAGGPDAAEAAGHRDQERSANSACPPMRNRSRRLPPGDLGPLLRFVPGVDAGDFNMYFHTDEETAGNGARGPGSRRRRAPTRGSSTA